MDYQEIEDKMQKAVDYLQEELVAVVRARLDKALKELEEM